MSAKFVDALMGYDYFITMRGKASLDDINDYLEKNGRNQIAPRTYSHYRSLMRYGFRKYFPINQFDVSRTLGQLPIAPDRRRYERERVQIEVKISSDENTWITAEVIDKSIVGLGLYTLQEIQVEHGKPIWVRIEKHHDIPALVY